jgi:hypothetical protein
VNFRRREFPIPPHDVRAITPFPDQYLDHDIAPNLGARRP